MRVPALLALCCQVLHQLLPQQVILANLKCSVRTALECVGRGWRYCYRIGRGVKLVLSPQVILSHRDSRASLTWGKTEGTRWPLRLKLVGIRSVERTIERLTLPALGSRTRALPGGHFLTCCLG